MITEVPQPPSLALIQSEAAIPPEAEDPAYVEQLWPTHSDPTR